jgi:hypothetical protein
MVEKVLTRRSLRACGAFGERLGAPFAFSALAIRPVIWHENGVGPCGAAAQS